MDKIADVLPDEIKPINSDSKLRQELERQLNIFSYGLSVWNGALHALKSAGYIIEILEK